MDTDTAENPNERPQMAADRSDGSGLPRVPICAICGHLRFSFSLPFAPWRLGVVSPSPWGNTVLSLLPGLRLEPGLVSQGLRHAPPGGR